VYKKTGE
jgi:hypothetical protein